eukprot:TRINITY_DN3798_c0_g1_i1.p1 TRINITY_DN3798_c0_g1~~TRINITY_DN3798_c0_g1_i1.p1  ORF type:complete len:416 (+),score=128.91 TRINITY_DN3798_c0_g1_i1:84-1250(+)
MAAVSFADGEFADQQEVLKIIAETWAAVNKMDGGAGTGEDAGQGQGGYSGQPAVKPTVKKQEEPRKSSWFGSFGSRKQSSNNKENAVLSEQQDNQTQKQKTNSKQFDVPESFTEMVKLNASMTNANMTYIDIMLDTFDNLVQDICKDGGLAEQTDILAMRIAKDVVVKSGASVKISEFKVVLLASLRSLRGGLWDTKSEKAWNWLWESVAAALTASLPFPMRYEKPVRVFLMETCEMKDLRDIGMQAWYRMFAIDPKAENFFKQSNERLIFIAVSALQFTVKMFEQPTSMHVQMVDLGLKHIMHKVEPKYFPIFIECLTEEIKLRTDDENVVKGVNWGLTVIGSILGRTVEAGSTQLLVAALNNNVPALKAELQKQPRGKRGMAVLQA